MYFHMFISGAEAGKLIGKQGLELKKMDEIPNLNTLQVCFYFDVRYCFFWNMDIFSLYTEVPD